MVAAGGVTKRLVTDRDIDLQGCTCQSRDMVEMLTHIVTYYMVVRAPLSSPFTSLCRPCEGRLTPCQLVTRVIQPSAFKQCMAHLLNQLSFQHTHTDVLAYASNKILPERTKACSLSSTPGCRIFHSVCPANQRVCKKGQAFYSRCNYRAHTGTPQIQRLP